MRIYNENTKNKFTNSLFFFLLLLVNSCSTIPYLNRQKRENEFNREADTESGKADQKLSLSVPGNRTISSYKNVTSEEIAAIRNKLLEGADFLLGKTSIIVRNKTFLADCINTILAIYYYAGIDLAKDFNLYTGNGVNRLYQILDNRGLIYQTEFPIPGDIIFWDNTWDSNGDGVWNDPLTHAGMVVEADADGNLVYIHYDYIKGIIYAHMNLCYPEIQYIVIDGNRIILNTPIQMKQSGKPHSEKWLSGQLYKAFGQGYLME